MVATEGEGGESHSSRVYNNNNCSSSIPLPKDIYDLELTEVHTNSELRKLLMKTTSKSIIVIEDIDCSINLTTRTGRKKARAAPVGNEPPEEAAAERSITLSGLLNFTDGLWSCCGSERLFVFTTNHIEKLDPALLRSGRMDMHILMSFCSFSALKVLMKNYLGLEQGELGDGDGLMRELEDVVGEAEMTPADISEVLIKNRRHEKPQAARELLAVLKSRAEERKAKMAVKKSEEVEEHEKRALESTMENGEGIEMCDGKVEKGGD